MTFLDNNADKEPSPHLHVPGLPTEVVRAEILIGQQSIPPHASPNTPFPLRLDAEVGAMLLKMAAASEHYRGAHLTGWSVARESVKRLGIVARDAATCGLALAVGVLSIEQAAGVPWLHLPGGLPNWAKWGLPLGCAAGFMAIGLARVAARFARVGYQIAVDVGKERRNLDNAVREASSALGAGVSTGNGLEPQLAETFDQALRYVEQRHWWLRANEGRLRHKFLAFSDKLAQGTHQRNEQQHQLALYFLARRDEATESLGEYLLRPCKSTEQLVTERISALDESLEQYERNSLPF